jgi:hypothetical protein
MKARTSKRSKDETLLISMAESIGSTLGTIASKANAAQKALTHSSVARNLKRERKIITRKGKTAVRKTANAARNLKTSKVARATRRGLRRLTTSAERAARRGAAKIRSARRSKARK